MFRHCFDTVSTQIQHSFDTAVNESFLIELELGNDHLILTLLERGSGSTGLTGSIVERAGVEREFGIPAPGLPEPVSRPWFEPRLDLRVRECA